ncbi:MAG: hypothetical protein ACQSGP_07620 [Frankia sp.]
MTMSSPALAPRVVVVHRRTEYAELIGRHGTRGQAAFFLSSRGRDITEVEAGSRSVDAARTAVGAAIPLDWRRGEVERDDLDRFLFAPDDVVVCVGQDGLVANVAKYLDGQPLIGIDPDPGRNAGVLVRHRVPEAGDLMQGAVADRLAGRTMPGRTMVEARSDDGQRLIALNEIYVGHPGHQSARYVLAVMGADTPATHDARTLPAALHAPARPAGPGPAADHGERQSSSGLLVCTGTGSTGWCSSVQRERRSEIALPGPATDGLVWFVREAWLSPTTGAARTTGTINGSARVELLVESDHLVAFGDGIETDALALSWGQRLSVGVAATRLALVE